MNSRTLVSAALLLVAREASANDPPLHVQTAWLAPEQIGPYALLDANGDGRLDLAALRSSAMLYVALADAHLDYPATTMVGTTGFNELEAGDIDGDGHADLVAGYASGIRVHLGHGDGAFDPVLTSLLPGEGADALELGDMDGDGVLDVLAGGAAAATTTVHFFKGNGTGTFTVTDTLPAGNDPEDIAIGDVNSDGRQDVAVANGDDVIGIFLKLPAGGWAPPTFLGNAAGGLVVRLVDLNGDAWPDLVAGGGEHSTPVAYRTNLGSGLFGPQQLVAGITGGVVGLDVGDLDGDGDADALAGRVTGGPLRLLRNAGGTLSFTASEALWASSVALYPRIADVDGDGLLDVVSRVEDELSLVVTRGAAGGFDTPAFQPVVDLGAHPKLFPITGSGAADLLLDDQSVLYVQPALGDGLYGAPIATPVAPTPFFHATAYTPGDFDGDGLADVLVSFDGVTVGGRGAMRLAHGSGDGQFVMGTMQLEEPEYRFTVAADLDVDGDLDALTLVGIYDLTLVPNDGAGVLGPLVPLATLPFSYINIAVGHLDGDGVPDLVVDSSSSLADPLAFHGLGGGALTSPESIGGVQGSLDVALADLDGDGLDEAIFQGALGAGPDVVIQQPAAGGGWEVISSVSINDVHMDDLLVGDVTGDGREDVVLAEKGRWLLLPGLGSGTLGAPLARASAATLYAVGDATGDGVRDVVSVYSSPSGLPKHIEVAATRPHGPWIVHDLPLAGTHGDPLLVGLGTLEGGTPVTLRLIDARPQAQTFLVVGLSTLYAPLKGGTLVPAADLLLGPFVTDPDGYLLLPAMWPIGLPPRLSLHFQAWIQDPVAVHGFAASGGLEARAP